MDRIYEVSLVSGTYFHVVAVDPNLNETAAEFARELADAPNEAKALVALGNAIAQGYPLVSERGNIIGIQAEQIEALIAVPFEVSDAD